MGHAVLQINEFWTEPIIVWIAIVLPFFFFFFLPILFELHDTTFTVLHTTYNYYNTCYTYIINNTYYTYNANSNYSIYTIYQTNGINLQ